MFDANAESEGHDFFRIGGMDISKDGRWMLYGVDVEGDERYDYRIRNLETGEELPEMFTGISGACSRMQNIPQRKGCRHERPIWKNN